MRLSIIYGAVVTLAVTVRSDTQDTMCVVQIDSSGGIGKTVEAGGEMKHPVVYEMSTAVSVATATAETASATGGKRLSTLRGTYTTISELDVTATLPVDLLTTTFSIRVRDDGTQETSLNVQPTEQTAPIGGNMELLYGCGAAPNGFIICPFEGSTPPAAIVPGYLPSTPTIAHIQRDAQVTAPATSEEMSSASVLASMVAATELWPTGVHPFMAPTPSIPAASDCVDSLAEEFAMTISHASHTPADSNMRAPISKFGINLVNGTLIDTMNRLGSIVANRQFQFDAFGQAGSIYTAGFQACGPPDARLLALGGSTVWWGCVSGKFMNLYDQNIAPQCVELTLPLLNNLEPGGDLKAVADKTAVALLKPLSKVEVATAHDKRLEISDPVARDLPVPFKDVPTVPAGAAKKKRQEAVTASVTSSTTTPVFLFTPATTASVSAPGTSVVSQPVATTVVYTTVTLLRASSPALQNTSTAAAITTGSIASPPLTELVTTVTEISNATVIVTQTHSTELVTLPQSSTSFVTAGDATITSTFANATTQVNVTSYATTQIAPNGISLSTTAISFLNISTFTATGLTLTHPSSTLLSLSATSDTPMTTEPVLSGSIGGGMPGVSTTEAVGSDAHKTHLKRGMVPIYTSIFVGLVVVWYADRYLGRLHV